MRNTDSSLVSSKSSGRGICTTMASSEGDEATYKRKWEEVKNVLNHVLAKGCRRGKPEGGGKASRKIAGNAFFFPDRFGR